MTKKIQRYRVLRAEALIIRPDGYSMTRPVDLVEDVSQGEESVGVRLIGDTDLKGTVIMVGKAWLAELEAHGQPADDLALEDGP